MKAKKIFGFILILFLSLWVSGCTAPIHLAKMALDAKKSSDERSSSTENVTIFTGKTLILTQAEKFSVMMKRQDHENLLIKKLSERGLPINERGDVIIEGEVVELERGMETISFRFIAKSGETIGTADFKFHKSRRDAPDKIADAIVKAIRGGPQPQENRGIALNK